MPKSLGKSARVYYGIFGNPHQKNVEKAINKWMKKGYRLVERDEHRGGCIGRGFSELTFVLDQK